MRGANRGSIEPALESYTEWWTPKRSTKLSEADEGDRVGRVTVGAVWSSI